MAADDNGGLLTADTLAETIHLEQWPHHEPRQSSKNCGQAQPENETATNGRHPTEILKQHRSKEDGSHKAYSIKNTPYQEVLVVLPNEGVERGDYVMLLLHLPVFERAKIRIIFQPLK